MGDVGESAPPDAVTVESLPPHVWASVEFENRINVTKKHREVLSGGAHPRQRCLQSRDAVLGLHAARHICPFVCWGQLPNTGNDQLKWQIKVEGKCCVPISPQVER